MLGIKLKWPVLPEKQHRLFIALLINAFSVGNIWILIDIVSHSFLLSYYSNNQLFTAFILAGAFITFIFLFLFFVKYEPTPYQKLLFLGGLNFLSALIYLLYLMTPNLGLLYALFCLGAVMSVFTLIFYSSLIEVIIPTSIRNNVFPLVDLTKHLSTVFTSLMALLILYMDIHIRYIALFSIVSAAAYMISLSLISKDIEIKRPVIKKQLQTNWPNLMPLIYVSFFVALASVVVHIQFVKLSINAYPNIWGIAKVLTLFYGTLYLFSYLTRKILIPRLLNTYDSPFSLVISPALFILAGIVFLTYYFLSDHYPELNKYIYPLLGILVFKIIIETTRNTVDIPALKVSVYSFLKSPQHWQNLVLGVSTGVATILAGILYNFQFGFKHTPLLFSIVIIVLGSGWIYFTVKLARLMQLVLKSKTVNKHKKETEPVHHDQYMLNHFDQFNDDFIFFFKRICPDKFPIFIEKLMHAENDDHRKFALMNISEINHQKALNILEKENVIHNPLVDLVNTRLQSLQQNIAAAKETDKIESLSQSVYSSERCEAARLIALNNDPSYVNHLIHLLRDIEPMVKIEAIRTARYYENSEVYYLLVDFLNSETFYSYAFDTLISKGNTTIDYIDQILHHEDFSEEGLFRIIKLLEKIATFRSVEKIIQFIDHPSRQINMKAIRSLRNMGYTADDALKTKLFNLIVRQSNIITWNISVIALLYQTNQFLWLRKAFDKELQVNYNDLFMLMHLLYPQQTIKEARDLLAQNTYSSVSYASELLDSVLQEDLKKVVLPIISYNSSNEKIQQLHYYYTLEDNPDELHKAILNRDINLLSPVTKAIAIFTLNELQNTQDIEEVLISALFNTHGIIRETAIYIIVYKFHHLLKHVYDRLTPEVQEEVMTINTPGFDKNDLLLFTFDKLANHKYLKELSSNILLHLTEKCRTLSYDENADVDLLETLDYRIGLMYVEYGNFSLYLNGERKGTFQKNDLVFIEITNQQEGDILILRTKEKTKLLSIEKNEFEKMCFDHDDLYNSLFHCYINKQHLQN